MADFVKVAKTAEIVPGQGKMIEVGGKKIASLMWRVLSMLSMILAPIAVGRFRKGPLMAKKSPVPSMAQGSM